jgi:pimeloyl-ACP methyl ester carboxylesterase
MQILIKLTTDQMRADNINEWNFGTWRRDLLTVLRRLLTYGQRALLIANDIGVWLAMLAAMRCPDMVNVKNLHKHLKSLSQICTYPI